MDWAVASCGVYSDRSRLVLSTSAFSPPPRLGQLSEAPGGKGCSESPRISNFCIIADQSSFAGIDNQCFFAH